VRSLRLAGFSLVTHKVLNDRVKPTGHQTNSFFLIICLVSRVRCGQLIVRTGFVLTEVHAILRFGASTTGNWSLDFAKLWRGILPVTVWPLHVLI